MTTPALALAFQIALYPVTVQGARLESEVGRALEYFAHHADAFDVIAIVRGGGARSDLAWFDNLAVARQVAKHPLKILIGIGHERDRSVLDEIAQSAKTPTAVAELLIARVGAMEEWVNGSAERLVRSTGQRLERAADRRASVGAHAAVGRRRRREGRQESRSGRWQRAQARGEVQDFNRPVRGAVAMPAS